MEKVVHSDSKEVLTICGKYKMSNFKRTCNRESGFVVYTDIFIVYFFVMVTS